MVLACLPATCPALVSFTPENNASAAGQPWGEYAGNVGTANSASVVYLGDGWAISAYHVVSSASTNVSFGGVSYSILSDSFHRLTNASGAGSDVVLFQLSTDLDLPPLEIGVPSLSAGSGVVMMGYGRTQQSGPTYWSLSGSTDNPVWTETANPAEAQMVGYTTNNDRQFAWGTNAITSTGAIVNYGSGDVHVMTTTFDYQPDSDEAQAVLGDSGGAVLSYDGGNWVLSGLMVAVATYPNQPANTAVTGNLTYLADLSYYASQISDIMAVPEPSLTALGAIGGVLLLRRKRPLRPGFPRAGPA